MVTFKGGRGKLYYIQYTLLSNVGQLSILFFFFFRNKHTHTHTHTHIYIYMKKFNVISKYTHIYIYMKKFI